MTDNETCDGCRFSRNGECRRYPPSVVELAEWFDGQRDAEVWAFPPDTRRCGEFKEREAQP